MQNTALSKEVEQQIDHHYQNIIDLEDYDMSSNKMLEDFSKSLGKSIIRYQNSKNAPDILMRR